MSDKPKESCFAKIPAGPRGHFLLHFYAAVYYLIYYIHRLSDEAGGDIREVLTRFPFLSSYFSEMLVFMPGEISWEQAAGWWQEEICTWETSCPGKLPLLSLSRQMGLGFSGRMVAVLVGLVEEDSRFGTIISQLQAPLAGRRPCQELVGRILMLVEEMEGTDPYGIVNQPGLDGLLEVADRRAPRAEWILNVPLPLWDLIRGNEKITPLKGIRLLPGSDFPGLGELILPADFLARLKPLPGLISSGRLSTLILRGKPGSERLTIMGALARELGLDLLVYERSGQEEVEFNLELAAVLSSALPVLRCSPGPGETVSLPEFRTYRGPAGIILGPEGGVAKNPLLEKAVVLRVPPLALAERRRHWQQTLGNVADELLDEVSQRLYIQPAYLPRIGSMARALAGLEQREEVCIADIRSACGSLNRQVLDNLANHLEQDVRWDQIVLDPVTGDKLRAFMQRCLYRERLFAGLGPTFGKGGTRGVKALFSGISGTGKTLAARIIAAELGMDIYRVDLAAVINKYIGETEKNLHRVLSRAEELDVLLLLDEGDALLGKRTDVKSANDRYANIETDYLLQRLENYQGIIIITTNTIENIDPAFKRRMDMLVNFVPPQPLERFHIWQQHLPASHGIGTEELEKLAVKCELTGAQIRNTVIYAALQALDEGGGMINLEHLKRAVGNEYRKTGGVSPLETRATEPGGNGGQVKSFFELL